MIWSPFGTKNSGPANPPPAVGDIVSLYSKTGVMFRPDPPSERWLESPTRFGRKAELVRFLSQLEEEGYGNRDGDALTVLWADVYRILESEGHADGVGLLALPPIEDWRLSLESRGSLADGDFSIVLSGWIGPDGKAPSGNAVVSGAVLTADSRRALLPRAAWETFDMVLEFHRNQKSEPHSGNAESNRKAWASIRSKAIAAGADLSDFLRKTVVLTPEKLDIGLRKGAGAGNRLVEVIPGFEGQPRRWIEMFDRLGEVPDRYEIPDGHGLIHVVISPEVRTVLREIKRMPGRRVAGARAEAFLRNPFATLGPDAGKVVDADRFERARNEAGISFARFTARVRRDDRGYPYEIALLVEEILEGQIRGEEVRFQGVADLSKFLIKLDTRIATRAQCCHWEGYDLEILGDTPDQAAQLRSALDDLLASRGFKASEIFDLTRYSERVEGFGIEKPYYSPFIARKNEEAGWFPENIEFGVFYTPDGGETVAIVLTEETLGGFREEVRKAGEEGRNSFSFPGCPKPVPVEWAAGMLDTLGNAIGDVGKGTFDPKTRAKGQARECKGLVVKPNIDKLDYEERRGALVLPLGEFPRLPASLKPDIKLKDHQKHGVAWLQHLWSKSPGGCRGAVLADDMGLGKTIQLLSFIAKALEEDPGAAPFLIVAPVSLLENWKDEISKFFVVGALRVLTLYGPALAQKRLPRTAVDKELAEEDIPRLLRRDWLDGSKIVLTTYETLRDLEFSLAMEKWSAIVCDEAQKIKNPNAMVTRAAKKQNARFRIACTGTPVENTLTDLWCLFDFVQPGLLGSLRDFGTRYRKPIEAETEEEKARVAELRQIIEPQLLRRTKAEVAKDLPRKIEVTECRRLPISDRQRAHYADAVGVFRRRGKDGVRSGIESHLGLLQYLRRLCSDPKPPGSTGTDQAPLSETEAHSPKMAWLLTQLQIIREKTEKAIIFCEFRDLQRTLQRSIHERFGFAPDVINGDTSAASENANNRQKRIRAFQEKPGFGVIVLSPLAVGFGVNIQAANHVVHFTRTWNPAKEDQATDRAYRIGQTKDVFVYYPVVVAEDFTTFDEKLDALLIWKRGLSTDMLNGTGELKSSDFGDLGAPGGGSAFGHGSLTGEDLEKLDPNAFETFCGVLWSKLGYGKTIRTPQSGDGGIDIIAISGTTGVLIQCKSSTVDGRELGWEAVKDVVAGAAAYSARYPGVKFSLAAVTNRRFNGTARHQAKMNHVELHDLDGLTKWLAENPISRWELATFLF